MPTLRQLRPLRTRKVRIRKVIDLSLPPSLLTKTGDIYRRIIDATASAIQKDLERWIRQNARPDDRTRTDATFTPYPGDLASVLLAVEGQFDAATIDAALADVGRAVDRMSFDKLKRIPGINPARIIPGGAGALARFRQTNALLIKSIPEQMAADVGAALGEVDVRQLHVRDVGEILAERFGVAESKGEFWARDQTLKLYANIQETRQRAAGASEYQWEDSDDERVRGRPGGVWAKNASNHWALRNTIQSWDAPPVTNPKTGARNHPGHDYQCRCSAYPLFEGDPIEVPPPEPEDTTPEEEATGLQELFVEPLQEPPTFERVLVQVPDPAVEAARKEAEREARRRALLAEADRLAAEEAAAANPIKAKASELSTAFNQVGETRSRGGSQIRDTIKNQIERTFPGAATKDATREHGRRLTVNDAQLNMLGADGAHYPDHGGVIVTQDVALRAQRALDALANGAPVDQHTRDGLRVVIHEELHGFSRSAPASYNGIGMILEEVGTELTARHVTGNVFGTPHNYGAYGTFIDQVRDLVRNVMPSGTNVDAAIRLAHTQAALVPGEAFTSAEAHLDAFLTALDLDDWDRKFIRDYFLKLAQ